MFSNSSLWNRVRFHNKDLVLNSKLPPIQPHTKAKHHILRYHLAEWFPILGSAHKSLRYIDGFAGPGEYEGGEPGSPIISLRTVMEHRKFHSFAQDGGSFEFLFVDENPDYIEHLQSKIEEKTWPDAFEIRVRHSKFEDALSYLLAKIESGNRQMPPTLIFIDPFGPAGFSMDLLSRLAAFRRVEVLINLNHISFVQWILADPTKHVTADRLYGGARWRPALSMEGPARDKFLLDEYENALREIGWQGTSFEMVNAQNQTVYNLVFGTRHYKGLEAMKRAMRNASQTGEFRYTDRISDSQGVLPGLDVVSEYPKVIGEHLFKKYESQEVAFDELVENEINWHRKWLPTDLRPALKYLEDSPIPRIAAVRNGDGRKCLGLRYPEGCFITFGRPSQDRPTQGQLL